MVEEISYWMHKLYNCPRLINFTFDHCRTGTHTHTGIHDYPHMVGLNNPLQIIHIQLCEQMANKRRTVLKPHQQEGNPWGKNESQISRQVPVSCGRKKLRTITTPKHSPSSHSKAVSRQTKHPLKKYFYSASESSSPADHVSLRFQRFAGPCRFRYLKKRADQHKWITPVTGSYQFNDQSGKIRSGFSSLGKPQVQNENMKGKHRGF